jgi:hypothetical protein
MVAMRDVFLFYGYYSMERASSATAFEMIVSNASGS